MLISLSDLKVKYDLKINGVIHIGAHYGQEFPHYHKLGIKTNNIMFFEPIKSNFEELQKRLREYKPLMFNLALGNENKEVSMFVETKNQGQSSSILKPVKHLTQYPTIVFDKKEKVNMVRLDDFLVKLNQAPFAKDGNTIDKTQYNLLNIDVQGYELEVLKGSAELLKTVDYIYTEINNAELYENCPMVEDLDAFLSKYGFERKETDWAGTTWGDALYIKNKNNSENVSPEKATEVLQPINEEPAVKPKLSVIIVGRNDNHHADFLKRLKKSVKENLQLLNLHLPHIVEYIIVDWGSDPGQEMYKQPEMDFIFSDEIKNIIVPKSVIATKFNENQFYQFFAKNVGIMNSTGEYVLVFNADNVLNQSLVESINAVLSSDSTIPSFYRTKHWSEIDAKGKVLSTIDCEGGTEEEKHLLPIYAGDFLLCKRYFLIEKGKGYDESNKAHQQEKPQSGMDGEILFNLFNNGVKPSILNDHIFHLKHNKGTDFDYVYNRSGYENTYNWGFSDLRLLNSEKNIFYLSTFYESMVEFKKQVESKPVTINPFLSESVKRKSIVMNDTNIVKIPLENEMRGNRGVFMRRKQPAAYEVPVPEPKKVVPVAIKIPEEIQNYLVKTFKQITEEEGELKQIQEHEGSVFITFDKEQTYVMSIQPLNDHLIPDTEIKELYDLEFLQKAYEAGLKSVDFNNKIDHRQELDGDKQVPEYQTFDSWIASITALEAKSE